MLFLADRAPRRRCRPLGYLSGLKIRQIIPSYAKWKWVRDLMAQRTDCAYVGEQKVLRAEKGII